MRSDLARTGGAASVFFVSVSTVQHGVCQCANVIIILLNHVITPLEPIKGSEGSLTSAKTQLVP